MTWRAGKLFWVALVCALLVCIGACERRTDADQARATPTPIQLATAWAGPKSLVEVFDEVDVPNYDLFLIRTVSDGLPTAFGVAIPQDERNFLEGRGALRALFDHNTYNPLDSARLAMLFLERGGEPLPGPRSDEDRDLGVTSPTIEYDVLTYYYERRTRGFVELLRSQLELSSLDLSTRSLHLEERIPPAINAHGPAPHGPAPHGRQPH